MIREAIIAFTAMIALDYVWGAYTKYPSGKESGAGRRILASAIILTNAIVTIAYVDDPRLIPVVMLGAFVGTWLVVRYPPDRRTVGHHLLLQFRSCCYGQR